MKPNTLCLICLILLTFIGCRTEDVVEPLNNENASADISYLSFKEANLADIKLSDIQLPKESTSGKKINSLKIDKSSKIIKMSLADGREILSINLDNDLSNDNYIVSNLYILKNKKTNDDEFLIANYTSEKPFYDYKSFTGKIEYFNAEGKKIDEKNIKKINNESSKIMYHIAVELGCYAYVIAVEENEQGHIISSTNICGGGGGGNSSSSGSQVSSGAGGSWSAGGGISNGSTGGGGAGGISGGG